MPQATQDVVSRVPQTTAAEFEAAVAAARDAFPAWRSTPVSARQRVMLKLQHLIRENMVCTSSNALPGPAYLLLIKEHAQVPTPAASLQHFEVQRLRQLSTRSPPWWKSKGL